MSRLPSVPGFNPPPFARAQTRGVPRPGSFPQQAQAGAGISQFGVAPGVAPFAGATGFAGIPGALQGLGQSALGALQGLDLGSGRPHPFNLTAPQNAPFQHGGFGVGQAPQQQRTDLSGPFGPQPTPLGPPQRTFPTDAERAATSQADLAAPGRGQFDFLSNVPPQFQALAQQPAGVAQGNGLGLGDPTLFRASGPVFSTNEGGPGITSTSRRSSLEAQGFGVSDDLTLPALPGGAPRLQPQDAALLGPETRAQLAFEQAQSPEGRADLAARGAASRARTRPRSLARAGRRARPSATRRSIGATPRARRNLGIPQAARNILLTARSRGERITSTEAKALARAEAGGALGKRDQKILDTMDLGAQARILGRSGAAQLGVAQEQTRGRLGVAQELGRTQLGVANVGLTGQLAASQDRLAGTRLTAEANRAAEEGRTDVARFAAENLGQFQQGELANQRAETAAATERTRMTGQQLADAAETEARGGLGLLPGEDAAPATEGPLRGLPRNKMVELQARMDQVASPAEKSKIARSFLALQGWNKFRINAVIFDLTGDPFGTVGDKPSAFNFSPLTPLRQ